MTPLSRLILSRPPEQPISFQNNFENIVYLIKGIIKVKALLSILYKKNVTGKTESFIASQAESYHDMPVFCAKSKNKWQKN